MRKLYLLIPVILSLAITFPTFAQDVIEVEVVGTRPGGSAWGSGGSGGTPTGPRKNINEADRGGGIEALKRRRQYVECYNQYMTLTAGTTQMCVTNAGNTAVNVQASCLAGAVIVGGVAVYAASPEITLVAILRGYKAVSAVGIAIGTSIFTGCQSLAGTIRTSQEGDCRADQFRSITAACGNPPP
ncbi:MAG: hypothetical protein V4732_06505 [Pseudomonadota bacterium]